MTRPKPLREHRYYKRVTRGRTTRCWGIAVLVGCLLPFGRAIAREQVSSVPVPFPTPAPSEAPAAQTPSARPSPPSDPAAYASAWTVPLEGDGPSSLTFTSSSLIVAGGSIPTEARALDDGRVLWTSKRPSYTAPVVAGNHVIATSTGVLAALDAATGQDVWTAELPATAQPPVVAGDTLLVAAGSSLVARRAADGTPTWSAALGANAIAPPAATDTLVVTALDDRTLAAFDRATGTPAWRERIDVTALALTALGDRVYISAAEGFACAHRLEHGRKDWCFNVKVRPIGAPVGDARYIYFAFLDNMVHVFDRRSGRRYSTPSLDSLPAAGPILTADHVIVPVVTGEFVLLALRNGLQASRVSTPRALELPSTRAAAIAGDGSALAVVITSAGGRYSAVLFSRKPPEPAPPPPAEQQNKTDGTASDTPPAPTTP
jgi:hypothetical protein